MKTLIYLAGLKYGCSNGQHIDKAIEEINKGNDVFILHCDSSIGICINNPGKNRFLCKMCVYFQKTDTKKYLPKGVVQLWMSDFIRQINEEDIPTFDYASASELRSLTFHGIEIGMGAVSTYISLTRNLHPRITERSRTYFDALIREQVITTLVIEKLQSDYDFGLFIFQNGRGAQFKPFLNFCQKFRINFLCTEDWGCNRTLNFENNFWCDIPHSISAYTNLFQQCWDSSQDSYQERERLARSFFENRRNAIYAGDKIYVEKQVQGQMPDSWDDSKENIVFFNSSEDEFAAVSKEFDDAAFFSSQLEGIKVIVEHYLYDCTKHFTLRVHPNLKNIPYKYHKNLYDLNYPNLTVIHGKSSISTYSLMDAADKIIVFGSTTGIESVYWGKPVICLAAALYRDMGIVYSPKTFNELWNLIDAKELNCLYSDKVLTYGYYYMSTNHPRTKYVNIDGYNRFFFNKRLCCYKFQTFLGSTFLYALVSTMLEKIRLKYPAVFREIPREEA